MKEGNSNNFNMAIRRFIAFIIDSALIYLIYILISLPNFVSRMNNPDALKSLSESIGSTYVAFLILPLIYNVLMWSFAGATLGMLATKIRVIDVKSGKKPRLYVSLWKFILSFVSYFAVAIGHLWMLWDKQKQTLSDKASKTCVVSKVEMTQGTFQSFIGDTSRWTLGKIILLISLLITSALFYTFHKDYTLLPEALDCLRDHSPDTNPDNNGYYSYIAFGVEPEMNSHDMGLNIVKSINSVLIDSLSLVDLNSQMDIVKRHQFIDNGLPPEINDILIVGKDDNYVDSMREQKLNIEKAFNKYQYLYDRYVELSRFTDFRKKLVPHFLYSSINPMSLVSYQRLFSAYATNEFLYGNKEKGIQLLKQGYATTTNILYNSDTLNMKLIGSIMYSIHSNSINVIIGYQNPLDLSFVEVVKNLEEPSIERLSLRKAYENEFIFKVVSSLFMMQNAADVWDDYIITPEEIKANSSAQYKMSAVVNHEYKLTRFLADYSELPYHMLPDKSTAEYIPKFSKLEYVNNLMGLILIQVQSNSVPSYNKYCIKLRDSAIQRRLQKVAVLIKEKKPKNVEEFLSQLPDELQNPYIRKPFKWNNDTKTVYFEGPAHESQKAVRSIKL